jgi:type II secretory pathway pseudopilin PulG
MIDLTQVILAAIALIGAVLTGFVIPWLNTKIAANRLTEAVRWAGLAVEAAEQMFGAGGGRDKMAYVQDFLRDKGVFVDAAVIEAAVYAYCGKIKEMVSNGNNSKPADGQ